MRLEKIRQSTWFHPPLPPAKYASTRGNKSQPGEKMGEQTAHFDPLSLGSLKPEQATEVELETGEMSRHGLGQHHRTGGLWLSPCDHRAVTC